MTVPMAEQNHIRVDYFQNHMSYSKLSKRYGHSRNTIKKICERESFDVNDDKQRKKKVRKAEAFRDLLKSWILSDRDSPKDQRRRALKLYEDLVEHCQKEGIPMAVGERSIRELVADIHQRLNHRSDVDIPLYHADGHAQLDFGVMHAIYNGHREKLHYLVITFPKANARYLQAFPGENWECLAQGMVDIFKHIGKSPRYIRFDNMSTAVIHENIEKTKKSFFRNRTNNFHRLEAHYCFISEFCNVCRGNEKGSVENAVGFLRRQFFSPMPVINDLKAFNRELLEKCDKLLLREHYKYKVPMKQLFEEEKAVMLDLPSAEFTPFNITVAHTDNYGIFNFDTVRYSTDSESRSCTVEVRYGAFDVKVYKKGKLIDIHRRSYGFNGEKEVINHKKFLPALLAKPGAIRDSWLTRGFTEDELNTLYSLDRPAVKKIIAKMIEYSDWNYAVKLVRNALEQKKPRSAEDVICLMDKLHEGYAATALMPLQHTPPGLPAQDSMATANQGWLDRISVKMRQCVHLSTPPQVTDKTKEAA